MAKTNPRFTFDKYAKAEVLFFFCIWLLFPMISDFEYSFNIEPQQLTTNYFKVQLVRRLIWGVSGVIPFYFYYKLCVQRLLIKKKYLLFGVSIVLFLTLLQLYMHYIEYPLIARARFLPEQIWKDAKKWGAITGQLHFTVHYALLEIIQVTALAYFINYDKQSKLLQQMRQAHVETELAQLKSKLQPHFFFNTLNNIYSLALEQSEEAAVMVEKLSGMMRYVLYEADEPRQLLKREVQFLTDYVDICSIRYSKRIDVRFDTQGIADKEVIAPLLLLPFIENAFKHGVDEETGNGYVEVITCLDNQELIFSVKNSKPATCSQKASGIGLSTTQQRLNLLYPDKHSLKITETDTSYAVFLTISLN